MKSIARKCLAGLMLLAALAVTVQLVAQQQPEISISGDSGTANPVPLINQPLLPDAAIPGGPGFTLTVNGTGFVSTSVVKWNGSARTTIFVSQSRLRATILASDIATASTASVTVVSPGSGGGTSNAIFFDVSAPTFLSHSTKQIMEQVRAHSPTPLESAISTETANSIWLWPTTPAGRSRFC